MLNYYCIQRSRLRRRRAKRMDMIERKFSEDIMGCMTGTRLMFHYDFAAHRMKQADARYRLDLAKLDSLIRAAR